MEQRIKTRQASDFADAVDARIEAATSSVVQPLDATLTALAAITTAADKLIYATGADAFSTTTLTAAARDLLDDVDASAMRTTLGLGTMATAAAADYLPLAGGTMTGNIGIGGTAVANSGWTGKRIHFTEDLSEIRFTWGNTASGQGSFVSQYSGNLHVGSYDGGTFLYGFGTKKLGVFSDAPVRVTGLGLTTDVEVAPDVVLARDAANVLALRNSTNAQTFRVYGTYTDGSNFVRASLGATSTSVTLVAETAGTGADNVDVYVTPAGSGLVQLGAGANKATVDQFGQVTSANGATLTHNTSGSFGAFQICWGNGEGIGYGGTVFRSGFRLTWSQYGNQAQAGHEDVGLARNAASVLEVNNGIPGTYGDLKLRTLVATNAGSNAKLVDFTSPDWAIRDGTGGSGGIYISNSSFSSMVAFQTGGLGISHGTSFWWSAFPNSQGANTAIARSSNGVVQINTGANNSFGDLQLRTLQGFYSYTDGSNYQGYKLTSGASSVTLSAETAGTGQDNIDLNLVPAGTGQTVVTSLYAHRDFSTAYSYGKMIQVTGNEGRTVTFGTVSGQPAIAFGSDLTTNFAANGYIYGHSGCLQFVGGANNIRFFNSIEIGYPATFYVATGGGVITRNYLAICDSAAAATDGADVVLRRDAANVLALRNGSNGQKLRVYGDYTGASQYCALELSCTQTGGDYFSHYIGPVNAGGSDYWNDNRGEIGGWAFLTISAMANPSGDAGALFFRSGAYYLANALEGGQNAYFDGRGSASAGIYGHKNYFSNTNTASHTLGLWQPNGHTKSALTVYTNSVLKAEITSSGAFNSYGAWTDDSNYVRASLAATSTSVTLAAQTAGTGADDVGLYLTPAGTGGVTVTGSKVTLGTGGSGTAIYFGTEVGGPRMVVDGGGAVLQLKDVYDRIVFSLGGNPTVASYGGLDILLVPDTGATVEQRNSTNAQTFRVYGTYTDGSNFVRASLAATSTAVTLAAETAGTGADEVSINLTPAGAYAARLVLEGSATGNPGWSIGETAASPYISGSSGGNNSISFKAYSFAWEQVNVGTAMVIESGTGCVGIGTASPTAYLDLPASTTSAASLRIRTGTAPTSPNSGDVWHDSTQKTLSYYAAGVAQTVNGVLFTQTQTVTVANTVTETALTGTGTGTLTLPANFFAAGKTIKIRALGYHSSTGSPNITIRLKLGSTTILTTGAIASGNGSDDAWVCDAFFTCRTTGGTGTVIGQGYYEEVHGNGNRGGMVNTATTTIDTTASQAISITVEWGTADAGNTISCTNVLIEVLN